MVGDLHGKGRRGVVGIRAMEGSLALPCGGCMNRLRLGSSSWNLILGEALGPLMRGWQLVAAFTLLLSGRTAMGPHPGVGEARQVG